jgi:hypothetical protein
MMIDLGRGEKYDVRCPPRIMLGKKAGNLYRALQTSLGGQFSNEALLQFGKQLVLLIDNGDSASSNRKAMLYLGGQLASSVLHFSNRCVVHQLFRSIVVVLERLDLIRSLYALTNVLNIASRRDQFKRAIVYVVRSLDYHRGLTPPPHDAPHRVRTQVLISQLLIERGVRLDFGSLCLCSSSQALFECGQLLCTLLQGPWDERAILHYCPQGCECGGTREAAIATISELLIWVFVNIMPVAPSFSRWTTLGPCCSWVGISVGIHDIFRRAWMVAFAKEAEDYDPDVEVGDDAGLESFSQAMGRRIARVTRFFKDDVRSALALTIGLVTKPIDELVLNLLHLDGSGRVLADVTSKKSSPVWSASKAFVEMLRSSLIHEVVCRHFHMSEVQEQEHMQVVRSVVLELAAAVHYRLVLYFGRCPFKLLGIVHPSSTEREQRSHAQELYDAHECCLDAHFSQRLRSNFDDGDELFSSAVARGVLSSWMNHGKVTVAHVERSHATNKSSFGMVRRSRRHVEGAVYHSVLKTHMASHVKRGRTNYTLPKNDAKYAAKLGLTMNMDCKRRKGKRVGGSVLLIGSSTQRPRGKFAGTVGNLQWRYIASRSSIARLARGGCRQSRAVEKAARGQWAAEWDAMSEEEKNRWEQLHVWPGLNNLPGLPVADEDEGDGGGGDLLDMLRVDAQQPVIDAAGRCRQPFPVDVGDDTWPVAADLLFQHTQAQATRFGFHEWRGGFERVGEACRDELRQSMCVDCDPALRPILRVHIPCGELHPGLCRGRDALIFDDAMALASDVQREMKNLPIGTLFGMHTHRFSKVYCLSARRQRDPPLLILAECSFVEDLAMASLRDSVCMFLSIVHDDYIACLVVSTLYSKQETQIVQT